MIATCTVTALEAFKLLVHTAVLLSLGLLFIFISSYHTHFVYTNSTVLLVSIL